MTEGFVHALTEYGHSACVVYPVSLSGFCIYCCKNSEFIGFYVFTKVFLHCFHLFGELVIRHISFVFPCDLDVFFIFAGLQKGYEVIASCYYGDFVVLVFGYGCKPFFVELHCLFFELGLLCIFYYAWLFYFKSVFCPFYFGESEFPVIFFT